MTLAGRGVLRACALLIPVAATLALAGTRMAAHQDPQRPPFRSLTNVVRVDAYPTTRDGKIIEGLTADDFEVLEDGVVQKIASFEFVRFPQSNPVEERRDPNSQREGFDLASDPSYRVFVIYLDNLHVDFKGSHHMRAPLINFLNRVLGPKDLFGVITAAHSVNDLMLGQKTDFIEEQLTKHWDWGRGARVLEDDQDLILSACGLEQLVQRRRVNEVFNDLEGLMVKLASVREERKNIVLVSDGWALPPRIDPGLSTGKPMLPRTGVTDAGKITLGPTRRGEISTRMCEELRNELSGIDFQQRLRDLLQTAKESNVTFYTVRPSGLAAPASAAGIDYDRTQIDSLRVLASNTDGIAVVNTNDLTSGTTKIADDLAAVYYLGYTPSNSKPDGRLRQITVRLKSSGSKVRARREYRAPSASDIEAMRAASAAAATPAPPPSAAETALAELKRLRPAAVVHTRGAVLGNELVVTTELTAPEIEAGRWKQGADVQVIVSAGSDVLTTASARIEPGQRAVTVRVPINDAPGPFGTTIRLRSSVEGTAQDGVTVARSADAFGTPLVFRLATPSTPRAAASVQFRRTERMQVRWPVASGIASLEARVLGRDGVPLELKPAVTERQEAGIGFVVADLNLAPLTAGEYIVEVKGTRGGETAAGYLAFRVSR